MTTVVVAEGLPALLKCHIRGDQPIEVVWRKNSIVLEQSPRLILQTVLDANSSLLSAELRIQHTDRSDSGLYVCIGSNHYGRDEDRISLDVRGKDYHFPCVIITCQHPFILLSTPSTTMTAIIPIFPLSVL